MRKLEVSAGRKYTFKHARWYWIYLIVVPLISLALVYAYQHISWGTALPEPAVGAVGFDEQKTDQYIANFDPLRYETLGSDYDNPLYFPERLGLSRDQIDHVYDYDFDRVAKTETFLMGVNRPQVLKYIFDTITKGAVTDQQKHLAVLRFLQKSGYNSVIWQPVYRNKVMVMDPLVLLELSEMRCGHVARVAVDLFNAGGYKARLVQLGGHVIAEIFYGGDWHYFDADMFGGGEAVFDSNGNIPSVAEMSQGTQRYKIDSLAGGYYEMVSSPLVNSLRYASYIYFSRNAYSGYLPSYYIKTATAEEANNYLYGWNFYDTVRANEIEVSKSPEYYMPSAVTFTSIRVNDEQRLAYIEWSPAKDTDHDLLGYRVFISNTSRGWDYLNFSGKKDLISFWSGAGNGGWDPQMYDKLFQLPPHKMALITTKETSIHFSIKSGSTYYITVMPYDAHGESVGKKLYSMSNEIKVSLDQ